MGLDANFPAVTINDPDGHVIVYDERHRPIGKLGPPPFSSSSVNVTCMRVKWENQPWYKLLNPDGFDPSAEAAYVSAFETHPLNPGEPYPIPACKNVSCLRKAAGPATAGGVAALGLVWRRRLRA